MTAFQGLLTKYQELAISGLAYGEILQSKLANTWILQTLQLVKHAAKNISTLKRKSLRNSPYLETRSSSFDFFNLILNQFNYRSGATLEEGLHS
jgi:hypothetical protein